MEQRLKISKGIQRYQLLTKGQRYQVQVLYSSGFSQRKRAASIGVYPSTISRELKRNRLCIKYGVRAANLLKDTRRRSARKHIHSFERPSKIIPDRLLIGWFPKKLSLGIGVEPFHYFTGE